MDCFPTKDTANVSEKNHSFNRTKQAYYDYQKHTKELDNYEQITTLLINALRELASDMSILHDIDADYLIVKSLLAATLQMQNDKYAKTIKQINEDYQWSIDLLLNKN